jgi:hypothetical protein
MEMVKYFAMAAALVASLAVADSAQAFGRHGCKSCSAGGCPGGVCAVPVAPSKMAAATDAPPAPAPVVAAAQPTTNSYAVARRGRFGWRR